MNYKCDNCGKEHSSPFMLGSFRGKALCTHCFTKAQNDVFWSQRTSAYPPCPDCGAAYDTSSCSMEWNPGEPPAMFEHHWPCGRSERYRHGKPEEGRPCQAKTNAGGLCCGEGGTPSTPYPSSF